MGRMTTHRAARRWAETWQRSWEARDVEAVVALYSPDTRYSSAPFREPYRGVGGARDYVSQAFAGESAVRAWFSEPIVDGDRAAVSWWAALVEDGEEVTLAGTSVLRFDTGGLVAEQWDSWDLQPGRSDPPTGWSPFDGGGTG